MWLHPESMMQAQTIAERPNARRVDFADVIGDLHDLGRQSQTETLM
jgi:hypothetical protein